MSIWTEGPPLYEEWTDEAGVTHARIYPDTLKPMDPPPRNGCDLYVTEVDEKARTITIGGTLPTREDK